MNKTQIKKKCVSGSDYRNWTCLHHAAYSGYTQTMEILLSTNTKLLDKTDEDGVPWKYFSSARWLEAACAKVFVTLPS